MRDYAYTLSDVRTPALSIECEPCGRVDRHNVATLIEQYGDARLPDLLHQLAGGAWLRHTEMAIARRDGDHEKLARLDAEQERAMDALGEHIGAALAKRKP